MSNVKVQKKLLKILGLIVFCTLISIVYAIPSTATNTVCPSCGGSGSTLCFSCGGSGGGNRPVYNTGINGLPTYSTLWMPCSSCSGTGRCFCTRCKGKGFIDDGSSTTSSKTSTSSFTSNDAEKSGTYSNGNIISATEGVCEDEQAENLFDNNIKTKFNVYSSKAYVIWENAKLIKVKSYVMVTGNDTSIYKGRNPKTWVLYGSNKKLDRNSNKWVKIHSVKNDQKLKSEDFKAFTFTVSPSVKAYKYFKLEITENTGDKCTQLSAFELKGTTYTAKATTLSSVKKKSSTALIAKWKKQKEATGYIVQYSTSSKFKNSKKITIKKSINSKKISKLKKGKKYFVRVKTYKTVNGFKIYSKWSKSKSVKL